ncbi:MAG: sulfotransferase domain-containing protein [Rubrobacteraceae bacterium]
MRRWARKLIAARVEDGELKRTREELARTKRQLRNTRQRLKKVARDYLLLKMPESSVCAEIGVDEGDFSRRILRATRPKKLHLIDPWEHQEEYPHSRYGGLGPDGQAAMDKKSQRVRDRLAGQVEKGNVVLHRLSSDRASSLFADDSLDWLYLDANHLYEFVKRDLELYYPKIKPGGYLCGDDYGVKGWWHGGVTKAVDEFVEEKALQLEVKATQFIIQKGRSATCSTDRTLETSSSPSSTREGSQTQHNGGDSHIGSLPEVLVIGTQKGGTTSFYNSVLSKHSHFMAAAKKEIHYFDTPKFSKGIEWYRSNFPPPIWKDGRKVITGEASPYYMFHPLAARRAASTVPYAKLIVLLRNPVDRAHSDYQHKVRAGNEHLDFEQAIEAEEKRIRGEKEKMMADGDYISRNYRRYSYLSRGIYVDQLIEWHKYFPQDQCLILKSEAFFEDPGTTAKLVFDFLDLPEEEVDVEEILNKGTYSPMNPDTRQRLEDYFEPHNQRLYEYLGVDFGW